MTNGYDHVTPGSPAVAPSAAVWNSMLDAGQAMRRTSILSGNLSNDQQDGTLVLVKNDSSVNRERFEVLGIDSPIITPTANLGEFKNSIMLKCSTPSTTSHTSFVILQEAIAAGRIGLAVIAGVTVAKLSITNSGDVTAGIENGVASALKTGPGPAQVIWKESGTGSKWGIVRIGQPWPMLGKTDASHAKGATGTVSIWYGTPGSETDSTVNVEAYNRFADVDSGKWVWLNHNGHGWYLTAAECV